jgi:hypothetical protein
MDRVEIRANADARVDSVKNHLVYPAMFSLFGVVMVFVIGPEHLAPAGLWALLAGSSIGAWRFCAGLAKNRHVFNDYVVLDDLGVSEHRIDAQAPVVTPWSRIAAARIRKQWLVNWHAVTLTDADGRSIPMVVAPDVRNQIERRLALQPTVTNVDADDPAGRA